MRMPLCRPFTGAWKEWARQHTQVIRSEQGDSSAVPTIYGGLRYFTSSGNKTGAVVALKWGIGNEDSVLEPTLTLDYTASFSSPPTQVLVGYYSRQAAYIEKYAEQHNVDPYQIRVLLQDSRFFSLSYSGWSQYNWEVDSPSMPKNVDATVQALQASQQSSP